MDNRVALRYAQALMDVGVKAKSLDVISEDMIAMEETINSSRELRNMLESPVVTPLKKLAVLKEIFGKQVSPQVFLFMELVVKKGRAELLLSTASEFRKLLDVDRNIVAATITSARDLDKSDREAIQSKLEKMIGKQIRPSFSIDPSLKAGFIARVGDTQIDASLSHQLELLREQFKKGGSAILN